MKEAIFATKDALVASERARSISENVRADVNDAILASENTATKSLASTEQVVLLQVITFML